MISFPFTKKKLLSLPAARQHKWIASWLRDIHIVLLSEEISDDSLEIVRKNLVQLYTWITPPENTLIMPQNRTQWLEFIADTFHAHQKETGLGLSEADLLPHVLTGDKSPDQPWKGIIPYQVALDNFRSAFNVGSIFRLIDGVGFESILMSSKTPGPENRQVEKTSMGSTGWIPHRKTEELSADLIKMKEKGYRIIGLETVAGCASYEAYKWPLRGVVVLGNEEYGISESVLQACDDFVHIPMTGFKNSINVANAFAVIAFHIASSVSGLPAGN